MTRLASHPTFPDIVPASTPCIRVCLLDEETGLCEGCGRTRDEIARWGRMSEADRLKVMAGLPARMETAFGDGAVVSDSRTA